jgi:hypothetical protein
MGAGARRAMSGGAGAWLQARLVQVGRLRDYTLQRMRCHSFVLLLLAVCELYQQ